MVSNRLLTAAVPTPRRRQPTDTRQAEIVESFIRLAAERSVSEITTNAIAKAMHLTQGALFKHFPSKEAMRLAVVDWMKETLMQRLIAARQHAPTPLAALRDMFMAHVAFVIEHPGGPRLVFGELQQPSESPVKVRVCQLMQDYRALIVEILEEAQDARLIRPDLDRQAAAALFLGAIQGLVVQAMVSGTTPASRSTPRRCSISIWKDWKKSHEILSSPHQATGIGSFRCRSAGRFRADGVAHRPSGAELRSPWFAPNWGR